ncbi:MAG: hypothetical protein OEY60_05125, partial [Nitrospira sp.]|nr:hypothetical protein [Nitrospira sp.]
ASRGLHGMGRVEQLIAHLEILCKRGAINIGQAPDMDEPVKSLFLSLRPARADGPSLERPRPGSQAYCDGEST